VRGSEQLSGSFAIARRNTYLSLNGGDKSNLLQIGKLATGIFVSFIVVYGDEVLQNLLFASIKTI